MPTLTPEMEISMSAGFGEAETLLGVIGDLDKIGLADHGYDVTPAQTREVRELITDIDKALRPLPGLIEKYRAEILEITKDENLSVEGKGKKRNEIQKRFVSQLQAMQRSPLIDQLVRTIAEWKFRLETNSLPEPFRFIGPREFHRSRAGNKGPVVVKEASEAYRDYMMEQAASVPFQMEVSAMSRDLERLPDHERIQFMSRAVEFDEPTAIQAVRFLHRRGQLMGKEFFLPEMYDRFLEQWHQQTNPNAFATVESLETAKRLYDSLADTVAARLRTVTGGPTLIPGVPLPETTVV